MARKRADAKRQGLTGGPTPASWDDELTAVLREQLELVRRSPVARPPPAAAPAHTIDRLYAEQLDDRITALERELLKREKAA